MFATTTVQRSHPGVIPFQRQPAAALALSDPGRTLDNDTFARAVRSVARQLQERGVTIGDVVAAMLPNRVELIVVMFAAWQLRAAFTPLNPGLTTREAQYQLDDAAARLVVVDDQAGKTLKDSTTPRLPVEELRLDDPWLAPVTYVPDDTALVIYTSGTTGKPKGVLLDHGNVAEMIGMIHAALGLCESDRALLVLPLFHVNALLVSTLSPLAAGGATVIREKFERSTFWDEVDAAEATFFSGVPAIYILLSQLPAQAGPKRARLRFAICGAAPMPAPEITRFESRYGLPLIEGYGLTESTVGATLNPLAGLRKAGTVGLPLPGVTVRILRDGGGIAGVGEVGEVVLHGRNVMRGYLGLPQETAAVLSDGWLRTGDVGYLDAEGYLTLVDRKKDMIIRGGENIYPKEVEQALYEFHGVLEAAVVGRPDPVMGEEPVAFVVARDVDFDLQALMKFVRERLARSKWPREVRVLPALPKNAVGKISKPDLRALLRGG